MQKFDDIREKCDALKNKCVELEEKYEENYFENINSIDIFDEDSDEEDGLSFNEKIKQTYDAVSLQKIRKLFNSKNKGMNFARIKKRLKQNWNKIQNSGLSYTSIPDDPITLLWCELAEYFVCANNRLGYSAKRPLGVVEALMPSIQTESLSEGHFPHLHPTWNEGKQCWQDVNIYQVIRTHITNRHCDQLIPINVLLAQDFFQPEIRLPYVYAKDSEECAYLGRYEMRRIWTHSEHTRLLYEKIEDYQLHANGENHLLGKLRMFCRHLKDYSVDFSGEEQDIGGTGYQMLLDFFEYYKKLSEYQINQIPKEVKEEIDEIFSVSFVWEKAEKKGAGDKCFAARRENLARKISKYENQLMSLSIQDEDTRVCLEQKKVKINEAKDALDYHLKKSDYLGADQKEFFPAYEALKVDFVIEDLDMLVDNIAAMCIDDVKWYFSEPGVQEYIGELINNFEELLSTIKSITPIKQDVFLEAMGTSFLLSLDRDEEWEQFYQTISFIEGERFTVLFQHIQRVFDNFFGDKQNFCKFLNAVESENLTEVLSVFSEDIDDILKSEHFSVEFLKGLSEDVFKEVMELVHPIYLHRIDFYNRNPVFLSGLSEEKLFLLLGYYENDLKSRVHEGNFKDICDTYQLLSKHEDYSKSKIKNLFGIMINELDVNDAKNFIYENTSYASIFLKDAFHLIEFASELNQDKQEMTLGALKNIMLRTTNDMDDCAAYLDYAVESHIGFDVFNVIQEKLFNCMQSSEDLWHAIEPFSFEQKEEICLRFIKFKMNSARQEIKKNMQENASHPKTALFDTFFSSHESKSKSALKIIERHLTSQLLVSEDLFQSALQDPEAQKVLASLRPYFNEERMKSFESRKMGQIIYGPSFRSKRNFKGENNTVKRLAHLSI